MSVISPSGLLLGQSDGTTIPVPRRAPRKRDRSGALQHEFILGAAKHFDDTQLAEMRGF